MADIPSAEPLDNTQTVNHPQEKRQMTEWKWQFGLRIFLLVLLLVDLALVAYCVSTINRDLRDEGGYWWFMNQTAYLFIPIGLSLVWTLVYLPLSFLKKASFHPGFAVGFDLILWLALVAVGLLYVIAGAFDYVDYDTSLSSYSYQYTSGYTPGQQGAPVRNTTYYSDYSMGDPYTYQSYDGQSVFRTNTSIDYNCPYYNTCKDQVHFYNLINALSHTALAASAILLICGLWHLALWIWACVDCARWNRLHHAGDDYMRAKLIAEEMIKDMQKRGDITIIQHQRPQPAVLRPTPNDQVAESGSSSHPVTLPQMQEVSGSKGKAPLQTNEPRVA